MNDYSLLLVTLLSTFLGYWFCGHCIAVARYGGPKGDGYEPYQRTAHPVRFWIYVVAIGVIGLSFASFAIYGFARLWSVVAHAESSQPPRDGRFSSASRFTSTAPGPQIGKRKFVLEFRTWCHEAWSLTGSTTP